MAYKKDLVEQCIKSDQYARETQGKLQVVADENRALKSRVATVAEALTYAESEVSPPIYTNSSGPLIRLNFILYSSHYEVLNWHFLPRLKIFFSLFLNKSSCSSLDLLIDVFVVPHSYPRCGTK